MAKATTATKTDVKAGNTEAAVAGAAATDAGVETPAEDEPVYGEGVSTQLVAPGTFSFSPIDIHLTPSERQARVLELLDQSKLAEGRLDFIQGELLWEANRNSYWKTWTMEDDNGVSRPFNSWDEFVEERLGLKRRTAFTRMDLYSTFVVKLNVPIDQLKDVDLSKAAAVTKIVKEDNWPAVLDAVKNMSHRQVLEFAKAAKSSASIEDAKNAVMAPKALPGPAGTAAEAPASGAATKESEGVKTFSIKLAVAQFDNVKAAIAVVKTTTGTDSDAQALDVLASEYLSSNSAGMKKSEVVERLLQNIETTYGVVVKIESVPADWADASEEE